MIKNKQMAFSLMFDLLSKHLLRKLTQSTHSRLFVCCKTGHKMLYHHLHAHTWSLKVANSSKNSQFNSLGQRIWVSKIFFFLNRMTTFI